MIVFVGVATLMLAMTGLLVLAARDKAVSYAETTTQNLAKALDQHAARTLEGIDQLLRDVVARIEAAPDDPDNLRAVQTMLGGRVGTLPQIRSILIFDKEGANILGSHPLPSNINVADRDHFTAHRDHPGAELFIGSPLRSRLSGVWTLVLSRRINRPDGSFFGTAAATLDVEYFERFFVSLNVGQLGAIGLFHANGTTVFRTPADPNLVGRDLSGTTLFREQLPGRTAGTYLTRSPIDGIDRIVSFDRVAGYPLVVTVALAEEELLAGWRKDAARYSLLSLAVAVAVLLVGWRLAREMRRREVAEANASRQAAILQTMLTCMPDGVQLLDQDAKLVSWNDELFAVMDLDKQSITDAADPYRTYLETLARRGEYGDGDIEEIVQSRLALAQSPDPVEYRRPLANGKWIECRRRHIPEGGSVALFRDVSSEVARENELRAAHARVREAVASAELSRTNAVAASRAKSEFLAGMSHELRTPLNAILGFSEVIANLTFGRNALDKYCEYAGDIQTSGQHLLSLINDILDLAKVEAGKMELQEEPFELQRLLNASIAMVREAALAGGVELSTRMPEDAIIVKADLRKIKQSVLNLLSNAVKFTPHGGSVTVTAAIDATDIMIEVIDTGIGIKPHDKERVFQRFAQVDTYLTRERTGTGLGLPLASAFVELHGGKLILDSAPGVGTTATIQLPLSRLIVSEPERLSA